jgi:hypothetical protein
MPQGDVLQDDFAVSAAGQGNRTQERQQQFQHGLIVARVAGEINATARPTEFWRTTPSERPAGYEFIGVKKVSRPGGGARP